MSEVSLDDDIVLEYLAECREHLVTIENDLECAIFCARSLSAPRPNPLKIRNRNGTGSARRFS